MRNFLLAFLSVFITSDLLIGQAQFTLRNDLLAEKDMHSAVPVAVADMNGDKLDDLVILDFGSNMFIQYQTPDPARPFVRYEVPVDIDNAEQNDIIIADFNNDGSNDILAVGSYDRVKVLYSVPFTYSFTLTYIVVTPFFSQGASCGDFNHDGWVDVVMLNDNGLNYTLMNDGTGQLVEQDLFNFVTEPSSDNSGNYGSVYTDFDMDGDLDFYIAKCRQGVNNPSDPRRINVLFVNDGTGNYVQDAANYGLASGRQTWTADFGDIDNDGDLDCFMTQHDVISELYENINNDTFINITPTTGLNIGGVPLQGMIRDFDNDGWQDILACGDRVDFYHNNGDKTFTKSDPFEARIFGTFGLGDLNNDGFTDIYASTVIPFNNPDPINEDMLFLNQGNDNHYLGLNLAETDDNPSAIGAMALLYGPWGTQIREVRGGEQYGVSNTHGMIFGLGQHTTYDSLVIRWPDGTREHFEGLTVDQTWSLRKGGCKQIPLKVFDPLTVLCSNDSITLKNETGMPLVTWSNGSVADSIVIKSPGLYFAVLQDDNGCPVYTQPMEVGQDPDTIKPIIFYEGASVLCGGDAAILALPAGQGYLWSTGETTQIIEVTSTGEYYALVDGYCIAQPSDTVQLDFVVPELPVTTQDTIKPGESAIVTATGDSIVWFMDPFGNFQIGTGNTLELDNLTDTTTVYAQNYQSIDGRDFDLGPAQHQGLTKYNAAFVNGGLLFDVLEDIVLHQITVFTDSAGTRSIDINNGVDFFYEYYVDIVPGMNVVNLDVVLPAGSYTITTNTDQNNTEFGVNSPYLWRTSEGVDYPYEIPGVVSITNSTFGSDFYYYFYDWKVSTLDRYCESALVPATVILDLETSTQESGNPGQAIIVNPNPTTGHCSIGLQLNGEYTLEVMSLDGVKVVNAREQETPDAGLFNLDLSSYPAGTYLVRVRHQNTVYTQKLVKL